MPRIPAMKIHLITNLFQPDELAGAALYTDMALFLAGQGHEVRVTTTFSYYPAWKLRPEDEGCKRRDEVFQNIPVRRLRMYVPEKPGGLSRIVSDLSFFWRLAREAVFEGWTPDVVLTACPMLSQCLAQRFLYRGGKIPRLIVVQDFAVDAALELGIVKLPGMEKLLLRLERWAFESAQTLVTISDAMLEKLRGKLGENRRTLLLPNWIHASLHEALERERPHAPAREARTLFYSGNLGVKQGLPHFVQAFGRAGGDWRLKIHGGGAEAAKLKAEVQNSPGISVGGVLEEAKYVGLLFSATACLITQRPNIGANFLPSKLLPALACGTPVLAVCDAGTPLATEVFKGRFGAVVPIGDDARLRETLELWSRQPALLEEMSRNALRHGEQYRRGVVLKKYEEELLRLAKQPA